MVKLLSTICLLATTFAFAAVEENKKLSDLWEARTVFSQPIEGVLTVHIENDIVKGHIANFRADTVVKDNWFILDFGLNRGRFKGKYLSSKKHLSGHWIQPATNPRVFNSFATPVRFERNKNNFVGHVEALENSMSQYMLLGKKEALGYPVVLINPEQNRTRFLKSAYLKIVDDKAIIMAQLRWQEEMKEFAVGSYDEEQQLLSLYIPFLGGRYDFKPSSEDSFYWPKGKHKTYSYRKPDQIEDDWPVATPEQVNVSEEKLVALVQNIIDNPTLTTEQGSVHAVLVARHGKLILEEYFNGFDRSSLHDTRSASKSLTGTLIGLAKQAGVDINLTDKLYETTRQKYPDLRANKLKAKINLQHILSMSTGLDCNDNVEGSPGNEDTMQNQDKQNDWFRYTLDLDAIHEPGIKPAYCSGGINLAGVMLSEKSGEWLPSNIDKYFAAPLGIHRYHVNLMPNGNEAYSGGGVRLRARDFLKLGQLMQNGGLWNGKRLIDKNYAALAISPLQSMFGQHYGLGWWRKTFTVNNTTKTVFYAGGNGGQQIIADIESGLLIVYFGGAYSTKGTYYARDVLTPKFLLNAVESENE